MIIEVVDYNFPMVKKFERGLRGPGVEFLVPFARKLRRLEKLSGMAVGLAALVMKVQA